MERSLFLIIIHILLRMRTNTCGWQKVDVVINNNMATFKVTDLRRLNTRSTADAVERPSPAYLLRAAGIDENT